MIVPPQYEKEDKKLMAYLNSYIRLHEAGLDPKFFEAERKTQELRFEFPEYLDEEYWNTMSLSADDKTSNAMVAFLLSVNHIHQRMATKYGIDEG